MNRRQRMLGMLSALLVAAAAISYLFSLFLPPSASLLAPTPTLTPTATYTRTVTPTPTITLTSMITLTPTSTFVPLPTIMVTANPNEIFPYGIYDQRLAWESAVGQMLVSEDFEKDAQGPLELQAPYLTGNGFLLSGKSEAEILNAPELS